VWAGDRDPEIPPSRDAMVVGPLQPITANWARRPTRALSEAGSDPRMRYRKDHIEPPSHLGRIIVAGQPSHSFFTRGSVGLT